VSSGDRPREPELTFETLGDGARRASPDEVRRFRLAVIEGPDQGLAWTSGADKASIGSHAANDVVLADPTVSRFHCEIRVDAAGAWVRDLGSRNGTNLDGVVVREASPRDGSLVRIGRTVLSFHFGTERNRLPISSETRFGSLIGRSAAMRLVFAILERAARSDVTVLLDGETGTGKEEAARSLHAAGARHGGPFVVVDCSAIPENLLESQLFGHEKGAFTGATDKRVGAFEEAAGGTIFLDEVGELPTELQPKLLRVLEQREVRRVGGTGTIAVNARVLAATNRDLREEVNAGRFRPDLYYRLAVLRIGLPPLRARPEDIPPLVERLVASLGATDEEAKALSSPELLAGLARAAWPGNVRELRNYLQRCMVLGQPLPIAEARGAGGGAPVDPALPWAEARHRALADFERRFAEALVKLHGGKVAAAAKASGIDRKYLYRLLKRHGIET